MKAWEIVSDGGIDALACNERPTPEPGPGEVLVRMRANSINYRDLSTVLDPVVRHIPYPRIPNSDGAGEVIATGPGVTRWKAGDRVAGCFFQDWPAGGISAAAMATALGGALDGVLAEEAVLREGGLVAIPDHLSFEEAACLPCAGLTAWNCLIAGGGLKAGDTVLLLGTGGVSILALQFALAAGAWVIITSSNDEKLERARAMGAHETINYLETPGWAKRVLELTGGRGADHVLEVGGPGTMEQSIEAAAVGGKIAYIGVLTGGAINPLGVMRKSIRLQGVYVGSRAMFEDMNRAMALHDLHPVIDQTFPFAEAREAFHHMKAAGHFGKIAIKI
jgi:NADPH:quinone reductase-like Zn-dependent oxidoreductase